MRRQPLLVQVLHGHVAVDQEVPPPVLGDVHGPGYRGHEGAVEDGIVVDRAGAVVIQYVHLAQNGCFRHEPGHFRRIFDGKAHPEPLEPAAVGLGAYVGYVESEPRYQLQDPGDASRLVLKYELHEHHGPFTARIVDVSYLAELHIGFSQALRLPFYVDEERMRVHGLVVADPDDVDPELREASAGLEERPDVVRHRRDV